MANRDLFIFLLGSIASVATITMLGGYPDKGIAYILGLIFPAILIVIIGYGWRLLKYVVQHMGY
jgi:hypothetical protein